MRKDPEKKQAGKEKKAACGDHFHLPFHRCGDYCNCRNNRLYDDKPAPAG